MTFEEYLVSQPFKHDSNLKVIDFAIRVYTDSEGKLTFYIHPAFQGGDTLSFAVEGNKVCPTKR